MDMQLCQKRFTAAQIRAGSVTALPLVPAQGVGTLILPVGMITVVLLAGTTGFSASADVNVGTPLSATLWQAGVTMPFDVVADVFESNPAGMAASAAFINGLNQPMQATLSAALTSGDGELEIIFSYMVVTVPYPFS